MAINYFEGGRRITQLFQGAAIVAGLAYVAFGGSSQVTFETLGPDRGWSVTSNDCGYNQDGLEFLSAVDLGGGTKRDVMLCFRGQGNGIPYEAFDMPRPADQPPPIGSGKADTVRMYRIAEEYSPEATAYQKKRAAEFRTDPRREVWFKEARDGLWLAAAKRTWGRLWNEALPWTGGFIFGLWVLSSLIGWIVRGFAGVPARSDFSSKTER